MKLIPILYLIFVCISCEKNQYIERKSELFREALENPLVEGMDLPILKNEFFRDFTRDDFEHYRDLGINIWGKDDLFMRGTTDFISIYEIELKGDLLVIHFRTYYQDQEPAEGKINFRS